MNIKTEFDKGQEVWFMYGNSPKHSDITEIRVTVKGDTIEVKYILGGNIYTEDEVFRTSEDLIVSVVNKVKRTNR